MFSCLRDRKDIKEPWDPKRVYGVCVGVIIFVSALFFFFCLKKMNCRDLWCIKGSLYVVHVHFLCACALVPVFIGLWAFASFNMSVTLYLPFCMHTCMFCPNKWTSLSCMPVILCMPLCAPQSFTWHQSESSWIVISLPTACCWLKPAVCTPPSLFLFFSLLSALSLASLSFASPPPSCLLHPSTPESHHSAVSPLLAAKKAPIQALQKVISSPFFLISFPPSFLCSFFSAVHLQAVGGEPPITYLQTSLEPFSCSWYSFPDCVSVCFDTHQQEQMWERIKKVCAWTHVSTCGCMCDKGCLLQLEIHKCFSHTQPDVIHSTDLCVFHWHRNTNSSNLSPPSLTLLLRSVAVIQMITAADLCVVGQSLVPYLWAIWSENMVQIRNLRAEYSDLNV